MKNSIVAIVLFLVIGGCDKIVFSIDNPFSGLATKVLMHRGSGNNPDLVGNTYSAAEYGLSTLDGIELDIQLSGDGTLWLDHDNQVHDCDGNVIGCFQEMSDVEIKDAAGCGGIIRYHTLESVFDLMASRYPQSYISLDIKGQYCQILNTSSIMKQMAQSVLALVAKYNMEKKVLIESGSLAFMDEMSNQSSVGQCVISLGDVDKGLADAKVTKARGISLKYGIEEVNAEIVALIHRKGYGIMLWSINEPADIVSTWNSHPDFIQTDNAKFKDYVPIHK
jgi:glycerophosphoryl diester phosphodiesterase